MTEIETKIAAFLKESHPSSSAGPEHIAESQDLFADGWMDSLLQLKLLSYLEAEFGLRVHPFQVSRKTFMSVTSIARLISERK